MPVDFNFIVYWQQFSQTQTNPHIIPVSGVGVNYKWDYVKRGIMSNLSGGVFFLTAKVPAVLFNPLN